MSDTSEMFHKDVQNYEFPKIPHSELERLHRLATIEGDMEAWQTLWMHGVRLVLKLANKMRNVGEITSHDMYNECISVGNVAIGEALLTWRPKKGRFSTWVWVQVRYAIIEEIKSEIFQGGKSHKDQDVELLTNEGQAAANWEEFVRDLEVEDHAGDELIEREFLLASLWMLTDKQAQYLREVYLEGRTLEQVAEDEGVSHQNIHYHIKQGIKQLREIL